MNTFGDFLKLTSFGESHGAALGFVLDGLPSGITYKEEILLDDLKRRRPGHKDTDSSRKEQDQPEILSGVFEGLSLGTPISCIFRNQDARSKDYKNLKPRKGHADQVWKDKFGHVDFRGGGRSSGRETVARVGAGAICKMFLSQIFPDFKVRATARHIGPIENSVLKDQDYFETPLTPLGLFSSQAQSEAEELLRSAKKEGESYGGQIEVRVQGVPKGLGEPVFKKLKSRLADAMLSVGAVKSFELGDPLNLRTVPGTDFHKRGSSVYGGVSGGISNGETLTFYCQIKPTSSILDVAKLGRHDPCILPRALVVLEAMTNLVLTDLYLQHKARQY